MRGARRVAEALATPLVAFLLVFFVVPIAWLLSLAVREAEVARALPRTLQALSGWHADEPLPAPLFDAFAEDIVAARAASTLADAARRLNYEVNGVRSTLMRAAREASAASTGTRFDAAFFQAVDPTLASPAFFAAVMNATGDIDGRDERAWLLPRGPVAPQPTFSPAKFVKCTPW